MRGFRRVAGLAGTVLLGGWLTVSAGTHATEPMLERPMLVELDGSGSSDPDGDRLQYTWKQVGGAAVTLSNLHAVRPYFRTRTPGVYQFELTVSDGKSTSEPALVKVEVKPANLRPEALVPETLTVEAGQEVVVSGISSRDADGDALSYLWRQKSGAPLFISAQMLTQSQLTFKPVRPGVYEFELVVSDGKLPSLPVTCRVVVRPRNKRPVARAAAAGKVVEAPRAPELLLETMEPDALPVASIEPVEYVSVGKKVTLNGRGSVAPGNEKLRYYWKQVGGPFIRSFDRSEDSLLRFSPPQEGLYEFELVVNDGKHDSLPQRIAFKASIVNEPPMAVVKAPETAETESLVVLDGSGSFDREQTKLHYRWRQVDGPRVHAWSIPPNDASRPRFTPREAGNYVFELVVTDGESESRPAQVTVAVTTGNRRPLARVAGNLQAVPGETVVLQGQGDDPDKDTLSYYWRQISGPDLLIGIAQQQSLTLTPHEQGKYVFELLVSDGKKKSLPAVAIVEVGAQNARAQSLMEPELVSAMENDLMPMQGNKPQETKTVNKTKKTPTRVNGANIGAGAMPARSPEMR